jgi:competence protein ComGC
MYCTWCGTQVPAVSYEPCPHCGKPTNGAAQLASVAPKSSNATVIIIVVAVVALLVVAIGGIVAAIAIPNFMTATQRAKQKRTMADIQSVATAVEAYSADKNGYPKVQSYDELRPFTQYPEGVGH